MSIDLDQLIQYWQGELSPEREAEVEEALFADEATARRLEAVARLDAGVREMLGAGKVESALTVAAVEAFEHAGLRVRTYVMQAGEIVPCSIASEDLVVLRLLGDFAAADRVDIELSGTFDGQPPVNARFEDVPVDRRAGAIVLVYSGERIRALPRSSFRYTVKHGEQKVAEYGLEHSPTP